MPDKRAQCRALQRKAGDQREAQQPQADLRGGAGMPIDHDSCASIIGEALYLSVGVEGFESEKSRAALK
ncbi:hypothetical protein SBA_ch1_01300 [Sphingomonas bisphenolicum]|uniref:Uncharacterized protein n=1 Tax=Sphingomonas bisphenolicum TaxID=296544 RepID=A0ABM7G077_9SPHN|nr:hypothetical protein SBA_ch1_01300 [Sphingomonas bisphenolicum]